MLGHCGAIIATEIITYIFCGVSFEMRLIVVNFVKEKVLSGASLGKQDCCSAMFKVCPPIMQKYTVFIGKNIFADKLVC